MLKLLPIIGLLEILSCQLIAQKNIQSLEVNLTGGFSSFAYKNDAMVIPRRRGSLGFGNDVTVALEYQHHFTRQRLAIKTGIGYSEKEFEMKKYTLGDLFVGLLPFGGLKPDTFYLSNAKVKGRYLAFPLSVTYRLSRNLNHAAQFFFGLQVSSFFRISTVSSVGFDPNYFRGSLALRDPLSRQYAQQVVPFIFSISPHIDLRIRCYKNIGVLFNLFPITFYCSSWTRSMTSSASNFNGNLGIYYQFSK